MNKAKNMEFINHTSNWVNGEILEAIVMSVVGALIILCSLLFWKFGTTPYAKSLIIPLLIVGFIPLVNGIYNYQNNKSRLSGYEQSWQRDEHQFLLSEQKRVKSFDKIFKYTYPFALTMTIGGAILFFIISSPHLKAISLAMMMLGLMAYFIDHFAKERADIYLEQIEEKLKQLYLTN